MERYGLPLAYLVMHAGWTAGVAIVAGARLTPDDPRPLVGLAAALATLGAGYGAAHALRRAGSGLGPVVSLALGAAWTLGAVWLTHHGGADAAWLTTLPAALSGTHPGASADALALLLVFFLWWRGQRTYVAPPEHDSTVRGFGFGALLLGGALLIGGALQGLVPALTWRILLFLGGGLPALSLARLQDVRRELDAGAVRGEPARLDAAWRRTLLAPVAAVVAVGLVASVAFGDPAARAAALAALGAAGRLALALLYWPLLVVGLIAEWLVYLLRSLLRASAGERVEPPPRAEPAALLERLRDAPLESAPWLSAVPWVLAALAAGGAIAAYWVTAQHGARAERDAAAPSPQREALGAWSLLLDDLRLAWRRLLARLRRRAVLTALAALPLARERARRAEEDAADPRAAYRQLLALGRSRAVPRRPNQTPDEYLDVWRGALPAAPEAGELTGAYRAARYGPQPPGERTAPAPAALRALLARIRAAFEPPAR